MPCKLIVALVATGWQWEEWAWVMAHGRQMVLAFSR